MMVTTTDTIERVKAEVERVSVSFGKMIRDYRIKSGLSVNEASRRAGLSWTTWKNIEDGNTQTLLQMFKAARVVGLFVYLEVEAE